MILDKVVDDELNAEKNRWSNRGSRRIFSAVRRGLCFVKSIRSTRHSRNRNLVIIFGWKRYTYLIFGWKRYGNISYENYRVIRRSCDSGYSGRFEFHGKSTVFGRAGSSPVDRVFVLIRYTRARRTKWGALERFLGSRKKCKKAYHWAISQEFEENFEGNKKRSVKCPEFSQNLFRKKIMSQYVQNCAF